MAKRLVAVNVVALGVALALFVWANTSTRTLAVAFPGSNDIRFSGVGPGWPIRVGHHDDQYGFSMGPNVVEYDRPDPAPERREHERYVAWMLNGSVGLFLAAVLALKSCALVRPRLG